ncbi:MAG: hypothetical protein FJZ01_15400 [Candidatus Sericytochromatia bacterium]|nr:hypothetical protein [Candidatus Tanganyikabacteria bacterium]
MAIGATAATAAPRVRAAAILRDGNPPAGMPADSINFGAQVRYEDRRSTAQVVAPPVIITAGALSAIYGFFATRLWPLGVGITVLVGGIALGKAFGRQKNVPVNR